MISAAELPAFSDSENCSSIHFPDPPDPSSSPDIESLRRLSAHLLSLRQSPDSDLFSDARITVGPNELPVHRCLLSARSPFFRDVFLRKEKALPVRLEMKELVGDAFDVSFEALVLVIDYLYSGRVAQLPKDVCMCADDQCSHAGCRPAVAFMLEVLFASFTFNISELVSLFQRHLLDIIDKIAIDEILVILCVANFCIIACERLLIQCVEIVVKSDIDIVTLEKTLPLQIVKQVLEARANLCLQGVESPSLPDKHVRRIYRALDSDDIELVKMLLKEGRTSLDDAYALHYAVAHSDTKITMELLDYGHADVNHMNPRGYSVLHVAAMRKEPKILVSLLTKGARPSDLTLDGRKAVQISKRVTKSVDYYRTTVDGRASLEEGRLCIVILEHAERRNPLIGEAFSLAMAGDDQHGILLYLENRVALARMLFPMEAKVAMDIAQVDGTLEFTLGTTPYQRSTVDLNKEPFKNKEEHRARIKALSKTVELGKRFFPRCSEYLDKIMNDDLSDLASVGHNASVEQMKRYLELQDDIVRAFTVDKEKFDKSALSSPSSSSTSLGVVRKRKRVWV